MDNPALLKRPWQATFLAVINIIGAVLTSLVGLILLFLQQALPGMLKVLGVSGELLQEEVKKQAAQNGTVAQTVDPEQIHKLTEGLSSIVGGVGMFLGIIVLGIAILLIFMSRGALKGQKWSPIMSTIFSAIALLGALSSLTQAGNAVPVVIQGFILYCAIVCITNPFFQKVNHERGHN